MQPDLKADLHAHLHAPVAFSIIRKISNLYLIPSVRKVCPDVRIAKYDVPGSDALGEKIGAVFAGGCDTAIASSYETPLKLVAVCIDSEMR